jgi:hypothetical protein
MNRFEQLIEYVINDEDAKARELFHDIVVEKSREIYENLMAEEAVEEELEEDTADDSEDDEESIEEGMMDNIEADEEQDMSMEGEEDFGSDEPIGGDAQDDFVDNVSADGDDMGGETEPATKDDILNLEDKLDQLMAEFEGLMGGEADMGDGDGFGPEEGGDAIEMDDTGEMDENNSMFENVTLKAAPKPVTSEEGGVNKKSIAPANAGAKGPIGNTVKPVSSGTNDGGKHDAAGAYSNQSKELIGRVGNTPAQSTQNLKPATKPHLGQASGVNTKSPVARS